MSDETLERLTEEVVRERTPIPGVPNNLEALLAAAKDAPLYYDDDPDNRAIKARQRLAAQAPALAQQVLDLRGAGGALAERLNLMTLSSHFTDCEAPGDLLEFDLCLAQPCVENRIALARWAELEQAAPPEGEEGERDE